MFRRCAVRLCQCIHLARQRGVLSRRIAVGSGSLVARRWQIHSPCEAETGNGHKRGGAKQAYRYGVLGHQGACRKRLNFSIDRLKQIRGRLVDLATSLAHAETPLLSAMDYRDGPRACYRSNGFTFRSNSSGKMIPWMTSRTTPFLSIITVTGRVSPLSNIAFVC